MQIPTFLSARSPLIASTAALVPSIAFSVSDAAAVVSAALVVSVFAAPPQAANVEAAIAEIVNMLKIFFIFSSS